MNQNKKSEIDFFDNFGDGYDVLTERAYNRLISIFEKNIRPEAGERMIDLGCGSGVFTARLAGRYGKNRITGADISQNILKKAIGRGGRVDYIAADIEKMPFRDESCDIVILSGVLHHFLRLDGVMREVYRILKRGGRCFAFDPNGANPVMWLYRNRNSPFFSSRGITANERLLSEKELRASFEKSGFTARFSPPKRNWTNILRNWRKPKNNFNI